MPSEFAHRRAFADSVVYWACAGAFGTLFVWSLQDVQSSAQLSSAFLSVAFGVATLASGANLAIAGVRLFQSVNKDISANSQPGSGRAELLAKILRLSLLSLACVALFWSMAFSSRSSSAGTTAAGIAVGIFGLVIRTWSGAFRAQAEGLVVDGPYRFIRHPKYLGTILVYAGAALLNPSGLVIPAIALVVIAHFFAARQEDRDLEKRFGAAAVRYRERVQGFLPRLSWIASRDEDRLDWSRIAAQPNGIAHILTGWLLWFAFLVLAFGFRNS
jgi:protein-S-isoprenylcysteine O-methyltransferase Ste14